jgi:predicted transcriptional regulator
MNLRALRNKVGLSMAELADFVGCHKQQIYNFETGRAEVPVKYTGKMAVALKVKREIIIDAILKAKTKKLLGGAK